MIHSGSASGIVDLLDQFASWVVSSAGWTQDAYATVGAGKAGTWHKGAAYFSLRALVNESNPTGGSACYGIAVSQSTSYSGSNTWDKQPGHATTSGGDVSMGFSVLGAGAISAYWFLADTAGDNVWIVALRSTNIAVYLGFGKTLQNPAGGVSGDWPWCTASRRGDGMNDANSDSGSGQGLTSPSWTPGYQTASRPVVVVYGTVDAYTGWIGFQQNNNVWSTGKGGITSVPGSGDQSTQVGVQGGNDTGQLEVPNYTGAYLFRSPKAVNGGLVFLPILLFAMRDASGGGGFSLLGELPVVAGCLAPQTAMGETVTIGVDTWYVFNTFAFKA